jgi:hypothetical protein
MHKCSITGTITLSSGGKVAVSGSDRVTLTLTPATGPFSGKFLDPVTGKKTPFGGVIYQDPAPAGFGLFLGADQFGSVEITP